MIIIDCQLFKFSLPLTGDILIKGVPVSQREGLLIKLISDDGFHSFGEVSPLPGMSKENVHDVKVQASDLLNNIVGVEVPKNIQSLNGAFEKWGLAKSYCPSVQFGFQCAVLSLVAASKHKTLARLLKADCEGPVLINGLLMGDGDINAQAKGMIEEGIKSIKLKVGRKDIREDISRIKALMEVTGDKAAIRLDANRSLCFEDALKLGEAIGPVIEFIEEPFKDTTKFHDFYEKTLIPVALDETLQEKGFEFINKLDGVDFLVIKPTIVGFEKAWNLVLKAQEVGLMPIISSSFESSIGLHACASLAMSSIRNVPMGLDTIKWFQEDTLTRSLVVEQGHINLNDICITADHINEALLEQVQ